MSTLETLQKQFQHYLLNADDAIKNNIVKPQKGGQARRLSVYGEGYYLRLIEALSTESPALKNRIGQNAFEKMARAYFKKHPSSFFSVRHIAAHLPAFLRQYYSTQPYLAELAQFEIALSNTLDAADAEIKTTHDLSLIPTEDWGNIRLQLHPSVHTLKFEWDMASLYKSAMENKQTKPFKKRIAMTVWRKQLSPYYYTKEPAETAMLELAKENKNFQEICQCLTDFFSEKDAAPYAVNTLVRWLNEEMISGIVSQEKA